VAGAGLRLYPNLAGRFQRSVRALSLVCVLVASVAAVAPAQAGPPLLCHPFDIGHARSLPWDTATGLSTGRADYAIDRLVGDTEALLGPATPVIVRMETLRRAAIYASRDRQMASQLLERLNARARASEQAGKPDPLALLDAAYVTGAFRQIGMVGGAQGFGERAPIARAVVGETDGTDLMAKSLAARRRIAQQHAVFRDARGRRRQHRQSIVDACGRGAVEPGQQVPQGDRIQRPRGPDQIGHRRGAFRIRAASSARRAGEDDPVHHPDVAFVQLTERGSVTGRGGNDEGDIRRRRGCHSQSLRDCGPLVNRCKGLHV
jgi:hypothetical protein